jgi:hypothetical protein
MNWHVQCGQCKSPRKTTAQRVEHGVHDRVVVLGQWTLRQRSPQTRVSEAMDQSAWTINGGGWVVLALVNAGLAEQKNRPRLNWFSASLLIGPLATFFIVA